MIKEELAAGRQLAVCPYAEVGMALVELLEKVYAVKDVTIFDNGLSKYNPAIHSVEELKKQDTENMTLILTSMSDKNSEEIKKQINDLGTNIVVRSILEPDILESPQKADYFQNIRKLLSCKKVKAKNYVRIGGERGDGGYIMVDDFNSQMHAYSVGIGDNVTWDMELAHKGIKVFMYDHTIYHLPQVHNNFAFQRLGVGTGEQCMPLADILRKNGDLDNRNLVLKMDIEGAEWDVLDSISSGLLNNFMQISLELHGICNLEHKEQILKILHKLGITHQAVWVHGNNIDKAETAEGILVPNLIETTYVRKDDCLFEDGACEFPMPLDLPNIARRRDFILGNWGVESDD